MQKFHIENGIEEIEIEVHFDFQSEERMTRDYPGCDSSADIYEVRKVDDDTEICLLPDVKEDLEEQLCILAEEYRFEENSYRKYGYMLEDY